MTGLVGGVVAFGLLAATALAAAATLRLRSLAEFALAAYLFAFGEAVLLVLLLSPFGAVERRVLLVGLAIPCVLAAFVWWRRGHPLPDVSGTPSRRRTGAERSHLLASRRGGRARARLHSRLDRRDPAEQRRLARVPPRAGRVLAAGRRHRLHRAPVRPAAERIPAEHRGGPHAAHGDHAQRTSARLRPVRLLDRVRRCGVRACATYSLLRARGDVRRPRLPYASRPSSCKPRRRRTISSSPRRSSRRLSFSSVIAAGRIMRSWCWRSHLRSEPR